MTDYDRLMRRGRKRLLRHDLRFRAVDVDKWQIRPPDFVAGVSLDRTTICGDAFCSQVSSPRRVARRQFESVAESHIIPPTNSAKASTHCIEVS
jgi:hypothetical protein